MEIKSFLRIVIFIIIISICIASFVKLDQFDFIVTFAATYKCIL
jgi:hypothetical protein